MYVLVAVWCCRGGAVRREAVPLFVSCQYIAIARMPRFSVPDPHPLTYK